MATRPDQAPAFMTRAVLGFNEQLERLGELSLVLVVAGTLTLSFVPREAIWFAPLLLFVIRPIAVLIGAPDTHVSPLQRGLIGWFGIRGIGSVYYMMYALNHGLSGPHAALLTWLTLSTVAASIIAHGISVTPLMNWYTRRRFGRRVAV